MMNEKDQPQQANSPQITRFEWGYLEIDGKHTVKDAKLYPGGFEEWDWEKTNTRHVPGIQLTDVKDLIEKNAKIVILSRGVHDRLQVSEETRKLIADVEKDGNVQFFIENTKVAVDHYNRLANENKPVGALIHSTC